MKLFIDATDNLKTLIYLDEKVLEKNYTSPRDQNVLQAIIDALETENITFADITDIGVHLGPGSFTGIRVGISIAQALALALNLKVNSLETTHLIVPNYGKLPSITQTKS